MAKIVTLYNHKGGVSKTTTTFNLAHLLAEKGSRVLVVDADPQCNITELLLAKTIAEYDAQELETGVQKQLPGTSLLDALLPRIQGSVPEVDITKVTAAEVTPRLHLIPGSVALNSIEDAIAEAHLQRLANKTHEKRTYVAIGDFLSRLAALRGYDYVFIDVGPSSGAITRSCFLSCDAFLIPVAPDRFNVQAIGTLSSIVDRWLSEHAQVLPDFLSLGLPVRTGKPRFLGTISQFFKTHRGVPKPGYKLWMGRIPGVINQKLLPVLKKHSTPSLDLAGGLTVDTCQAAAIPDFGSMGPLLQETGKAVFQITQADTALVTEKGQPWGGATWADAKERIEAFKSALELIAARLAP